MMQQISSLFINKKSLFSEKTSLKVDTSVTMDTPDEFDENKILTSNTLDSNDRNSPLLSRNNSVTSNLSSSSRNYSLTSLSRNNSNSFIGTLFPMSSTSRPTSGVFNFNNLFFNENVTPLSRGPSLDFLPSRLKRTFSITHEPDNTLSPSFNKDITSRMKHDFQMIELIGTGTFGMVYKARGLIDNISYAIKKSDKKFETNEEKLLILREVHALASLSEENDSSNCIVRYYSSWFEDDYLCIQMELCDSSTADIYEPLPTIQCYQLLKDILNALDVLHRNNFVHLNLKPENILCKKDHYKLTGFTSVVFNDNNNNNNNDNSSNNNQLLQQDGGDPLLDTRYIAKELLSNEFIEDLSKCDIFSLALTVYGLSTGTLPPPDGILWHQLRDNTFEFPITIDLNLIDIITSMGCSNPSSRPTALSCLQTYSVLMSIQEIQLKEQLDKIKELERQLQLLTAE